MNNKTKKILFVEDDRFYADLIAQKFTNSKLPDIEFEFNFAFTGDDALVTLQKFSPDVVLLDIMLPGKTDGFVVLEKLKSDDNLKKVPVIVLSNLDGPQDVAKGMQLGAFLYLIKSSTVPSEVLERVHSLFK
jgi:DNA-binding response OmpR family regulator